MKKILSLALIAVMCVTCLFSFGSCGQTEDKLIVGYTIYEPMNYLDENGTLTVPKIKLEDILTWK